MYAQLWVKRENGRLLLPPHHRCTLLSSGESAMLWIYLRSYNCWFQCDWNFQYACLTHRQAYKQLGYKRINMAWLVLSSHKEVAENHPQWPSCYFGDTYSVVLFGNLVVQMDLEWVLYLFCSIDSSHKSVHIPSHLSRLPEHPTLYLASLRELFGDTYPWPFSCEILPAGSKCVTGDLGGQVILPRYQQM